MKKGLISVIIPCYNYEKYLEDTVKCLENQTCKNFEVIFVDDGSTDGTLQKMKTLCEGKENFKVLTKKNGGVSSARNYGLAHAEGEFVMFYDADDLIATNHFEVLLKEIGNFDCLVTACKNVKEGISFQQMKKTATFNKTETFEGPENLVGQLLGKKFLTGFCNKLLRHKIIKEFETYPNVFTENIHYGEDTLFGVEYFMHCKNAKYINFDSYYYRRHSGSLSKSFGKKLLSIKDAFDKLLNLCQSNEAALQYIKSYICMMCIELLFRARHNKFYDKETIDYLFGTLKKYKKDLWHCKKALFYYRYLTPCTILVLKVLFIGKIKKSKE